MFKCIGKWLKRADARSDSDRHQSDYKFEKINFEFQHKDVTVGLSAYGAYNGIFITASKEKTSKDIASWHPHMYAWDGAREGFLTDDELIEIKDYIYNLLNNLRKLQISKKDFEIKVEAVLKAYIPIDILDKYADEVEEEWREEKEKGESILERIAKKEAEIRERMEDGIRRADV